ncbi:ABC-2 transporter permease [Cellulosilyticum ruminicola]|uniref:ABC-2 transporter permease n=1 Tax=Cellulosilyticum ruminicola TaxID=425254 RepID=UPI0006D15BEF|nr:ABC-2 transporter permease [Cellulosilyticum ruminicola]
MIGQLIKKDFIHLTCSLRSVLISWILICLCLAMVSVGTSVTMPAFGAYMLFYSMKAYEERSKGYLLTASLPVKRKEVCKVQYLEALIFLIISMPCSALGLLLQNSIKGTKILPTAMMLLVMFGIGLIYVSIIIPCVAYFGTHKSRYAVIIFYGFVVGVASVDIVQNALRRVAAIGRVGNVGVFIGIACLSFLLSYEISLWIFKNKDFK